MEKKSAKENLMKKAVSFRKKISTRNSRSIAALSKEMAFAELILITEKFNMKGIIKTANNRAFLNSMIRTVV